MSMIIPQAFQDAVEAAIEKNDTVLSKVTQSQIKEITGDEFENYQIAFYLKEYRKMHKPISKAKQFEMMKDELMMIKSKVQHALGLIDEEAPLDVIKTTLSEVVGV